MVNLSSCAEISEMLYYALHPEEQEEDQDECIRFDVSFLNELVPGERDWVAKLESMVFEI